MKKKIQIHFFSWSDSKRWRRMPHGTSLIQLISLRLVQVLCSYILNPKVQVVVSQCILHMSVSEKICNSPLSSKVFSSSQFHPCIFIYGFFIFIFFIPAYSNLTRAYPMLWVIFFRIRIYLVFLCTFSLLLCTYLPIKRKGAFYTIPI